AVSGLVSPNGSGWQTATVSAGDWSLDYTLATFDGGGNALVDATGFYTLSRQATDRLSNTTAAGAYLQVPFRLDTRPPTVALASPDPNNPSAQAITQTITLSGFVTDTGPVASGVQSLDIDIVPSGQVSSSWQTANLLATPGAIASGWDYQVPSGLEGVYQLNLRGQDVQGNLNDDLSSWWTGWQGEIDTLAPRATVTITHQGNGQAAKTHIEAFIEDRNLVEAGLEFPCAVQRRDRGYLDDPFINGFGQGQQHLVSLRLDCRVNGFLTDPVDLRVFDVYGHERFLSTAPPALPGGAVNGPSASGPAPATTVPVGTSLAAPLTTAEPLGPSPTPPLSAPVLASTVLTPS
ncbi:MAG TPA: hypothetical protein VLA15_00130, partial [Desulfurivibrionaceae bacterium]|nr:hypothetical protein [Desulfurivibrionaceae bacterium]